MFEHYLTAIILRFANKYIKNVNTSELKLSLWGGAVTLNNIDLQVDVAVGESCHFADIPSPFLLKRLPEGARGGGCSRMAVSPAAAGGGAAARAVGHALHLRAHLHPGAQGGHGLQLQSLWTVANEAVS